jgi:hypothetical protein
MAFGAVSYHVSNDTNFFLTRNVLGEKLDATRRARTHIFEEGPSHVNCGDHLSHAKFQELVVHDYHQPHVHRCYC